jgi:hypothetical protein
MIVFGHSDKARSYNDGSKFKETPIESLEEESTLVLNDREEEETNRGPSSEKEPESELVKVEPLKRIKPNSKGQLLANYNERRKKYGGLISFGTELYYPEFLRINVIENTNNYVFLSDELSSTNSLMYLGSLGTKFHWPQFSIGLDFNIGIYNVTAGTSNVSIFSYQTDIRIILEPIFKEPYIVPYGTIGGYYKKGSITVSNFAVEQVGLLWSFGAQLQLNWLEKTAAAESYISNGIENTFIYFEYKTYLGGMYNIDDGGAVASSHFGAGLRLEL